MNAIETPVKTVQYIGKIYWRAFELPTAFEPRHRPHETTFGPERMSADTDEALDQVFQDFNHAIPDVTGRLAEKYKTRSLSCGDYVALRPVVPGGGWTIYRCAPCGWEVATPEQISKHSLSV